MCVHVCGVLSLPFHLQVEVVQMDTTWVRDNIRVYTDSKVVGNLASLGNFARFYFHKYVLAQGSVDCLTDCSIVLVSAATA